MILIKSYNIIHPLNIFKLKKQGLKTEDAHKKWIEDSSDAKNILCSILNTPHIILKIIGNYNYYLITKDNKSDNYRLTTFNKKDEPLSHNVYDYKGIIEEITYKSVYKKIEMYV